MDNILINVIEVPDQITVDTTEIVDNISINVSEAGSVNWGNILGILSNQVDLQNALDAKENLLGYIPANELINITGLGLLAGQGGDLTANRTFSLNNIDINHDQLSNYSANDHINHSLITITGAGLLAGQGGDLTGSRTFTLNNIDIDHNQLTNSVGLANQHSDIDNFITTVPTTYLKLDCSNDPLTGTLNSQSIIPSSSNAYDLGDLSDFFQTLYLSNNGGNVLLCEGVQPGGGPTSYTFNCGGGSIGSEQNQGGVFTFEMNSIFNSSGTSVNQMIFDIGQVDFLSSVTNDIIFQANNGIATIGLVAAFGGWSNPEYGFQLRNISGADANGKTIIFDNQTIVSDVNRSIDLRINNIDVLTIENETGAGLGDYTVDFPLGEITSPGLLSITAPTGLQVNGYGAITSSTVFGLVDIFTVKATSSNVPVIFGMRPDGTNTLSLINCTNSSNATNYGVLEGSISGNIAKLATWRLGTGTGPTELRIGEMVSSFLAVGTCDSLTTIDLYFANAVEYNFTPSAFTLSDGNNIIVGTGTGTQIGTATSQKIGFFGVTPVTQRLKSNYNNWAALSDIVNALVDLGLFDQV